MDPAEKFERLIDEARSAARGDLERIDRLIAGSPVGSLAETPCRVMLGGGPGTSTGCPCGATPTVGGNGLYRYCERHMRMVAKAGAATLRRDADADLQIDDNGDLVAATLASIDRVLAEEPPGSVRAIACRALTGVSLDEFRRASERLRAEELEAGMIAQQPLAVRLAMRELARAGQIPTEDIPPRHAMTQNVDAEQFLSHSPVHFIHITNRYDDPAIVEAITSEAGQKAVLNVLRGSPVRRREEEIAASRATGYAGRPLAERAAMRLYDEVNPSQRLDAITLAAETDLRCEEIGYDGLGKAARDLGCTCTEVHNARSADGILEAQHDAGCVLRDWRIRARRGDLQVVSVGKAVPAKEYTRLVYGREVAERLMHEQPAVITNHYEVGPALTKAFEIAAERASGRTRETLDAMAQLAGPGPIPMLDLAAAQIRHDLDLSPPLRPDGFSQAAVDAAKAVLLAPAAKRGGR